MGAAFTPLQDLDQKAILLGKRVLDFFRGQIKDQAGEALVHPYAGKG